MDVKGIVKLKLLFSGVFVFLFLAIMYLVSFSFPPYYWVLTNLRMEQIIIAISFFGCGYFILCFLDSLKELKELK